MSSLRGMTRNVIAEFSPAHEVGPYDVMRHGCKWGIAPNALQGTVTFGPTPL